MQKHKAKRKNKQRKKRRTDGNPVVEQLAGFLNIDLNLAGDIMDKWHLYSALSRGGDVELSTKERKRYMELKPLVGLLNEQDTHSNPGLLEQLQKLQQEVKAVLKPLFVQPTWMSQTGRKQMEEEIRKRQTIRGGMQQLVAKLNQRQFRTRWALCSFGEINKHDGTTNWMLSYDPDSPAHLRQLTDAERALLTMQRAIKIGDYQYIVRHFPGVGSSIPDRLYWIIGQALTDGTIGTLKICAECEKYFAAHDTKQVCCRRECYLSRNARDTAARVQKFREKRRQ